VEPNARNEGVERQPENGLRSKSWHAAYDQSGRRVPDFFLVGHPKCGTTALHQMLRTHPQVFMPELKEPRFMGSDIHVTGERRKPPLPRDLDQYLALFAAARDDEHAGEASPMYLVSHRAAGEIAAVAPDARIIAIVREPASLLRSLHMQHVQSYVETCNDLRRSLAMEDERRRGKNLPNLVEFRPEVLFYSDYVRFVEQLRRYEEFFPREHIHVAVYDDLRADNEAAVRAMLAFLGVDDDVGIEAEEANRTVRVRSQPLHSLTRSVSVGTGPTSRAVKSAVKAVTPQALRRRALHTVHHRVAVGPPGGPDEELERELRLRYRGEVVALSEYLDRDLVAEWGYDSPD